MLEVYSAGVTVAAGGIIPLDDVKVWKNRTSTREGNSIALNARGVYRVSVDGYGTSTTAGEVQLQLYREGIADPSAISVSSVTANGTAAVGFTTYIQVDRDTTPAPGSSPVTFQLINGELETDRFVNVTVERIA